MAKYNWVDGYIEKLVLNQKAIKEDNELIINELFAEHVAHVPNSKIYKYRTVNDDNLKALENDYVWLSTPSEFEHQFDTTINLNIDQQLPKIEKTLLKNNHKFAYYFVTMFLTAKRREGIKVAWEPTQEQVKEITEQCYSKKGRFIKLRMELYCKAHNIRLNNIQLNQISSFMQILENDNNIQKSIENCATKIVEKYWNINIDLREMFLTHSFTTDNKNEKMWTEYSDNHKGYIVGYDLTKPVSFLDKKVVLKLFPMNYIDMNIRKPFNFTMLIEGIMDECIKATSLIEQEQYIAKEILAKDYNYDYENEWRFYWIDKSQPRELYLPYATAIYLGWDFDTVANRRLIDIAKSKKMKIYIETIDRSKIRYEYKEYGE
jgi:hypothetical protein